MYDEKDPRDYVHSCYRKETYLQVYSYMMQPMNNSKFWAKTSKTGNDPRQPPLFKKMPRRHARNRRKEISEGSSGHK
ncbi:hypothetical protein DITRI_Ditri17bG0070700 [Diplodiscus trichospermus]